MTTITSSPKEDKWDWTPFKFADFKFKFEKRYAGTWLTLFILLLALIILIVVIHAVTTSNKSTTSNVSAPSGTLNFPSNIGYKYY